MRMLMVLLAFGLSYFSSAAAMGKQQPTREQQHRNLIIGGHDAQHGRYPYFATFDHFGGGVLIAPDIILTGGHVNPPPEQKVKVRINHDHFQSTNFAMEPDDEETFSIVEINRHPNFYTVSWDEAVNDYSLFKISGFSQQTPVKLNRNPNLPHDGDMVTVVGMGSMSPDPATFVETSATTLQEVNLKILSHDECETAKDPARPQQAYAGRIIEASMVCTSGGPHNEKDACAFDSGSPLLLTPSNSAAVTEDLVVGLVSWGENCADPFFPAVNARVSFAMDWIDKTVCELSDADPSQLTEFNCAFAKAPETFPWGPASIHKNGWIGRYLESMGRGEKTYYFVAASALFVMIGALVQRVRRKRWNSPDVADSERVPLQGDANKEAPSYDSTC